MQIKTPRLFLRVATYCYDRIFTWIWKSSALRQTLEIVAQDERRNIRFVRSDTLEKVLCVACCASAIELVHFHLKATAWSKIPFDKPLRGNYEDYEAEEDYVDYTMWIYTKSTGKRVL